MSELDLYGDLIEPGEGDGTVVLPVEANVIVKQEDDPQDSLYNGIFCSLDSPVKRPQVTLQYFHRLVCIQCRNCTQFFACSFSVALFLSYLLTINFKDVTSSYQKTLSLTYSSRLLAPLTFTSLSRTMDNLGDPVRK